MKKISRRSFLQVTALGVTAAALAACGESIDGNNTASSTETGNETGAMKVGFVYIGDDSQAYTANYILAETAIKETYGDKVQTIAKYNVAEDAVESPVMELCEAGCSIIFTTSFGYGEVVKEIAQQYPNITFCQATCADADESVPNYHNYMGAIYEGRYVAGIVAGMKLAEQGIAAPKIGYVAAFPYAEVISGYTAFLLGVRSVVADATMEVMYANTWGDYDTEKTMATALIEGGCHLISQHSDTEGPAEACEDAMKNGNPVYCVAYNQDMTDVAPNTCLISSRINWVPYEVAAVEAVMNGEKLPVDAWAGFDENWVVMTELNTAIAAPGTQEAIDAAIEGFKKGEIEVFKGNYTGADPWDPTDTIDLTNGYIENETQSAPTFHWVLDNVITIKSTN